MLVVHIKLPALQNLILHRLRNSNSESIEQGEVYVPFRLMPSLFACLFHLPKLRVCLYEITD